MNKFLIKIFILFFLFINQSIAQENIMILKLKDGDVKIELFEDVAFFLKARKITKIHKLNIPVLTSVRRFEGKGFLKMNVLNTFLMLAYLSGVKTSTLHRIYYK